MILSNTVLLLLGGGVFVITLLIMSAFSGGKSDAVERRLLRVGGRYAEMRKTEKSKPAQSVRRITADSGIPLLDTLIKALMPNPDKLRMRLARTGRNISLGEYLLINITLIAVAHMGFHFGLHWSKTPSALLGIAIGLYIPHLVVGMMGSRRIRKFLGGFPEAID
ncbi:MAG: hypothetical protein AB7H77_02385, partial [Bdellovibrionales bacterium]